MKKTLLAVLFASLLLVPACAASRRTPKVRDAVDIPSMEPEIIAVSAGDNSLILLADKDRLLYTLHYGCKVEDPREYSDYRTARFTQNGNANYTTPYIFFQKDYILQFQQDNDIPFSLH